MVPQGGINKIIKVRKGAYMPQNTTKSKQNIILYSLVIVLCILNITFLTGNILGININNSNDNTVSALSYQTESNMSFTFDPMISISISSNTIDIPSLAPGTTAESNPITVTVGTNTAYGYSLYADVGNSTDYNTDSLIHEDNSNNNEESDALPSIFASIDTNASLPSPHYRQYLGL